MCIYVKLNHCALQWKLTQLHKSPILHFKENSKKIEKCRCPCYVSFVSSGKEMNSYQKGLVSFSCPQLVHLAPSRELLPRDMWERATLLHSSVACHGCCPWACGSGPGGGGG